MKQFKIGVQLYGLRHTLEKDFEGTLAALAKMGYEYVEFAGYYGKSSEEIREVLDKYGLKCVSVHQGIDFYDDDPAAKAEFLKGFGVEYSIIPWYPKDAFADEDSRLELISKFEETAKTLQENGLKLGYHNHDFEFEKAGDKMIFDQIFDYIDEELIFPEFDTCWVRYAGLDPVEMMKRFPGRVPVIHLKDFTCKKLAAGPVYDLIDTDGSTLGTDSEKEDNGFEYRPLGQGMQNVRAILEAADELGTEYVIVEQDDVYRDMTELEAAKLSRDYLRITFGM